VNDKRVFEAVKKNPELEKTLDKTCKRILKWVFYFEDNRQKGEFDFEKHHDIARQIEEESIVLLKNEGVLPLKNFGNLAVIGEFAEKPRFQGGGSSHINTKNISSAVESLKKAGINFTYVIGRSPFLKLEKKQRLYSLPDTIRWAFQTDALLTKVYMGLRPDKAEQTKVVTLFPDGVPQNTKNEVAIPVRETFGDDPAIFPLWLEYINFLVDTKTTSGDHTITLWPIELIYNEYTSQSALPRSVKQTTTRKVLDNGQLLLIHNGIRYSVLGQIVNE
jgi:hypothetical protein